MPSTDNTVPVKTPATGPIQDTTRNVLFLPIELPSNGPEKFWLYVMTTQWTEAGRTCTQTELRSRCRDCNWGYNCGPFVHTENFRRIGEDTEYHGEHCKCTGRTIDLMSSDIDRLA